MDPLSPDSSAYSLVFDADGVFLLLKQGLPASQGAAREKLANELDARLVDLNRNQILHAELPPDKRILIAPAQSPARDAQVHSALSEDGRFVLLSLEPAAGRGAPATRDLAFEKIRECGADGSRLDPEKIDGILDSESPVPPTVVGERTDGTLDIVVSKDRLQASVTLVPPFGGQPLTVAGAVDALAASGIKRAFIDEGKIRQMLESGNFGHTFTAASGVAPEHGQDAFLRPLYDLENPKPAPAITEEGDVDYYELGLFSTVRIGDAVAQVVHAAAGHDGEDVFGRPIAAKKGREISTPCGRNTEMSLSEADTIVSTINGRPSIDGNRVSVDPILEVNGNVDFSTGNIDFKGFVNIKGNVLSGFKVKASHDVNIEGTVEAAEIEAGGDLAIKQGVMGQGKAAIKASGDLFTKYLDKATVVVDGNLVVIESILHSDVSVDGGVFLGADASNPRAGRIIGGVIRAKSSIRANVIGNELQTETRLEIGLSKNVRATLTRMNKEIEQAEREVEGILKSMQFIERKIQAGNDSPETQAQKRQASLEAFHKKSMIRKAKEKVEQIRDSITSSGLKGSKVLVKNTLYPGVHIVILDSQRRITERMNDVVVYEYNGDIMTAEHSAAFSQESGMPVPPQ